MKKEWNKTIWIAQKIVNVLDDYGRPTYSKPKKYEWNVQATTADDQVYTFGEKANLTQKALIERAKYEGKFKEFDLVYLDGATPEGETVNGMNANYRMLPPRNQNKCIRIYFEKIIDKK